MAQFESWETTDRRLACRDHILDALRAEMAHREDHDDWVERERQAVASAATAWSREHHLGHDVTVADVERVEGRAMGHVDYGTKLALYVAELVVT